MQQLEIMLILTTISQIQIVEIIELYKFVLYLIICLSHQCDSTKNSHLTKGSLNKMYGL